MPGVVSIPTYPVGLTGGRTDKLVIGSGRARPGGVENIWEYNGALLNVRDWYDTFIITSIDGLADPDVRDSRDVNPGRDGETYFQAYYGGRTIVISGKIRAFSLAKLRDMQMGLKQIFADLSGEKPLYVRTGKPELDVFIYCKKSQPLVMGETQGNFEYTRDFQITLRASNPRFLSYLEQRIALASGFADMAAMTNPGQVVATNLLTTPTATSGQLANVAGISYFTWGSPTTPTGQFATYNNFNDTTFPGGKAFSVKGSNPTAPNGGNNQVSGIASSLPGFIPVPGNTYRVAFKFRPMVSPNYSAGGTRSTVNSYSYGLVFGLSTGGDTGLPAYGGSQAFVDSSTSVNEVAFNVTVPANAISAKLVIYTGTGPGGGGRSFDFRISDLLVANASQWSGGYFDGEDAQGIWMGTRYLSTSQRIQPTGLEGFYAVEAAASSFYLGADGWIKPLGGNFTTPGTGIRAVYRSDQPISYSDLQITVKYRTGASVSPANAGFFEHYMKRLSALDYIGLRVVPNGASTRVAIYSSTTAGGQQLLAQSATFSIAPNTTYWLRARAQGNTFTVEHWTGDPALGGGSAASAPAVLSGALATQFGTGVQGRFGIRNTLSEDGMDWWWQNHDIDPVTASNLVVVTASNEGNAPAQPTILIYGPVSSNASGGNAVRVGLTRTLADGTTSTKTMWINAKTGTTLAIPAGNYILIDSDKRTLKEYTSAGVFVRNSYDQLDISSDWIDLLPGDNPLEFQNAVAGTTPTVEIRYRHTFF
jgi:hypothetical protein